VKPAGIISVIALGVVAGGCGRQNLAGQHQGAGADASANETSSASPADGSVPDVADGSEPLPCESDASWSGRVDGGEDGVRQYQTGSPAPDAGPFQCNWLADFDGDGTTDCVDLVGYSTLVFRKGLAAGGYAATEVVTAFGPQGRPFFVIDLNHDSRYDIVKASPFPFLTGTASDSISIARGQADGTFDVTTITGPVPHSESFVRGGDFDGDGFVDLLGVGWPSTLSWNWTVIRSRGESDFQITSTEVVRGVDVRLTPSAFADMDKDGHVDIVALLTPWGMGSTEVSVAIVSYGNGDGTFDAPADRIAGTEGWTNVGVGDFNCDDTPDLKFAETFGPSVVLYGAGATRTFSSTPP
jgi:hypothetical protein